MEPCIFTYRLSLAALCTGLQTHVEHLVTQENALEVIMQHMETHVDHSGVQGAGIGLLHVMATYSDLSIKGTIASEGCVSLVTKAWKAHKTCSNIVQNFCCFLYRIYHPSLPAFDKTRIIHDGGLETLAQAMLTLQAIEHVEIHATRALGNMICDLRSFNRMFQTTHEVYHQAVIVLSQSMLKHKDSDSVQLNGGVALGCVAWYAQSLPQTGSMHVTHQTWFRESGAIKALLSCADWCAEEHIAMEMEHLTRVAVFVCLGLYATVLNSAENQQVHMYVYMYVCMCVCVYIYIYIYIYAL